MAESVLAWVPPAFTCTLDFFLSSAVPPAFDFVMHWVVVRWVLLLALMNVIRLRKMAVRAARISEASEIVSLAPQAQKKDSNTFKHKESKQVRI